MGRRSRRSIKFGDWFERCSLGVLVIVGGVLNIISRIAAIEKRVASHLALKLD